MNYKLQDLIDMRHFQNLQDRLHGIYAFPSAIIDNDGNVLTATGWQEVCTKFHRTNRDCLQECIKSDQYILSHLHEANPAVSYRCPHGLVDNATPIIIDGVHYGNFFTGQFFLEKPDLDFFRAQARRYGFDEAAYLEAVKRVPIWSKEQLNSFLFFIKGLIEVISQVGLKSLKEAEVRRQVLESSKFNQQVIDSAHEGIIVYGKDLRYQLWNRFMEKLSGRKASEVLGKHPLEVFPFLQEAGVIERLEEALSGRFPSPLEFSVNVNGRIGWNVDTSVPLQNAAGEVIGVIAVVQDITERKRALDALRISEAQFAAAFRASPAAVNIATLREGRIVDVNQRYCQFFGYTRDEVIGRTVPELGMWAEPAMRDVLIGQLRAKRAVHDHEARLRRKDGTVRDVLISVEVIDYPGAAEPVFLSMFTDITERKQAEAAVRLRGAALEAAANAVVITDRQGIIEWVNPAFTALSGWSLAEAIGKNPRDLVKSGRQSESFYREMWNTILAGRTWRGEVVNRHRDGTLRTEEMTITPLCDEGGDISHFIAIKQDITQKKSIEAQFLQSQRMEVIGSLAGGVAHDLNNILSPISLVGGLLKGKLADPGDQEILEMALSGSRRGAEIIRQLLSFGRGQEGERVAVQPRYLIREIVQMMRETFPRNIDLSQRVSAGLWMVRANSTQLHQVLLNLCVNARDALRPGGCLSISASNVTVNAGDVMLPPGKEPGPYVVIEVSDTGHGIPPEIQHRIFDPFFTTKPLGEGTGLGLSTVLGIVENHGGFIRLNSSPGQGSTFQVHFPAMPDGSEAAVETAHAAPVVKPRGQMILVVDDERNVREATRLVLERAQFQVLTATHGEDALGQFLQHRAEIKLVLTDVMMPVMSGVTLVRALRTIDPAVKIIATSGFDDVVQGRELAALGVLEVLLKPCSGSVLIEALHRQLTGS